MSEDALHSAGLQRDLTSGRRAADLLTFACSSRFALVHGAEETVRGIALRVHVHVQAYRKKMPIPL